jgi:hypothetical protein
MEPLEMALTNVSSTRAVERSARPLSIAESKALTVLLDQMAAHYPHQTITDETGEIWREAIEILVARYTLPRVRTALSEFLVKPGQKFFPHPSEIAEALEQMVTEERRRILRENPFIPCGRCDGGIVLVNRDGSPYDSLKGGPVAMHDCDCKVEWRRRTKSASIDAPKPAERPAVVRKPHSGADARGGR